MALQFICMFSPALDLFHYLYDKVRFPFCQALMLRPLSSLNSKSAHAYIGLNYTEAVQDTVGVYMHTIVLICESLINLQYFQYSLSAC